AICDGRHLHPGSVRMLLKCKGWDKVVAVTDSIMAAGLPDGAYKLGVNDVVVVDGDAKLADTGVRAGSTRTTAQARRNLVKFTGRPVEDVLPLLTENPALLLRMDDCKGSLAPGKDADVVLLADDLSVRATIVRGDVVYDGMA
ncbi:MAG: amidohydrolase family protein, partial [Clostridia bacterium]|nr:amidohydrolase family protein [Clostridia bacterium]